MISSFAAAIKWTNGEWAWSSEKQKVKFEIKLMASAFYCLALQAYRKKIACSSRSSRVPLFAWKRELTWIFRISRAKSELNGKHVGIKAQYHLKNERRTSCSPYAHCLSTCEGDRNSQISRAKKNLKAYHLNLQVRNSFRRRTQGVHRKYHRLSSYLVEKQMNQKLR